jgi:hypothetical protein
MVSSWFGVDFVRCIVLACETVNYHGAMAVVPNAHSLEMLGIWWSEPVRC